jgi:hypothetical protein
MANRLQDVGYRSADRTVPTLLRPRRERSSYEPMHSRRLEDRIRELSALAISETEPDALSEIHRDLRTAVHQYLEQLRKRAASALVGVPSSTENRREKSL